jgi:hypothetical protein
MCDSLVGLIVCKTAEVKVKVIVMLWLTLYECCFELVLDCCLFNDKMNILYMNYLRYFIVCILFIVVISTSVNNNDILVNRKLYSTYKCPPYTAADTSMDLQNYAKCYFKLSDINSTISSALVTGNNLFC